MLLGNTQFTNMKHKLNTNQAPCHCSFISMKEHVLMLLLTKWTKLKGATMCGLHHGNIKLQYIILILLCQNNSSIRVCLSLSLWPLWAMNTILVPSLLNYTHGAIVVVWWSIQMCLDSPVGPISISAWTAPVSQMKGMHPCSMAWMWSQSFYPASPEGSDCHTAAQCSSASLPLSPSLLLTLPLFCFFSR